MSELDQPITFFASFPPIQSAIKTGRDGARIQFDVPASEMAAIVRMVALQTGARLLKVTIETEPEEARVEESLTKNGSTTINTGTARRPTDLARG